MQASVVDWQIDNNSTEGQSSKNFPRRPSQTSSWRKDATSSLNHQNSSPSKEEEFHESLKENVLSHRIRDQHILDKVAYEGNEAKSKQKSHIINTGYKQVENYNDFW